MIRSVVPGWVLSLSVLLISCADSTEGAGVGGSEGGRGSSDALPVSGGNGVLLIGGRTGTHLVGDGSRVEDVRTVSDFVNVRNESPLVVIVQQAERFRVRAVLDSNLVSYIETTRVGDSLVVDVTPPPSGISTRMPGPHVVVELPRLSSLTQAGSGEVNVSGVDADLLELRAEGSGDLTFSGSATRLRAESAGSGDVLLGGTAAQLELSVRGSGSTEAKSLVASRGSVAVTGSGDVEATFNEAVSVGINGSGDVTIFGGAEVTEVSRTGSGRLMRRP